jgi:hypothetical protein
MRNVTDILGRRFEEVVLPIPKDARLSSAISTLFRGLLAQRVTAREQARQLGAKLEAGTRLTAA